MDNLKSNALVTGAVFRTVDGAVWNARNGDPPPSKTTWGSPMKTDNRAVTDAVRRTVDWAVYGAVWGAVVGAVWRAVIEAVDRAVVSAEDDSDHPGLQDFMCSFPCGAVEGVEI